VSDDNGRTRSRKGTETLILAAIGVVFTTVVGFGAGSDDALWLHKAQVVWPILLIILAALAGVRAWAAATAGTAWRRTRGHMPLYSLWWPLHRRR
jgi:hypothetical protein